MPTTRPEVAVGAVVIEQGRLLLIQRGTEPGLGLWSVPGGRVEAGERLADAVVREVAEETGLAVRCGRFIGYAELIGPHGHGIVLDFAADVVGSSSTLRPGDDAAAARWVELDRLELLPLVPGLLDFLTEHGVLAA